MYRAPYNMAKIIQEDATEYNLILGINHLDAQNLIV